MFARKRRQCAQQSRQVQRNGDQAQQQADAEIEVGLPVVVEQQREPETRRRHADREEEITVAIAQAVADRHPHDDDVDPGERLAHADHRGAHQSVIGNHADGAARVRYAGLAQDAQDEAKADRETGCHHQ
jgi:hypothetical protein